ncbi:MAG: hypothetical protein N2745_00970, partial [Syntrophorhabdaceae bacterium]|nr:hypothetical protein [Syntrophorhabdaceae bacterium]
MDVNTMKILLNVAKGIEKPDVVIVNGRIVNVFTDEILEGHLISIKNGFIVSVEEANRTKYDEKVETI